MKKTTIALLLLVTGAATTNAQTTLTLPNPVNKIEVTGSAEMEVVPDEIYIGITLQEYYRTNKEKVSIDDVSKNFLTTCEKAGITKDRIEVQNMSGFDQSTWWQRKRKKEQPDLMQYTTYVVKFSSPGEIDKLVNLLDDNSTQNIYIYKTSSSKEEEYRKQLKIQALQNAKAKAQYLLAGIGEKAGDAVFVKEVDFNQPVYPMYKEMMLSNASMDAGGGPSANEGLNFKKIKYRYEIEAHFEIN